MKDYEIIEQILLGKAMDANLCEDGIYIGNGIIAVIDGATSKSNKTFNNKKGGRLAMELILEALDKLDVSLPVYDKLSYLSNTIKEFKEANNIDFPVIASIIFYDCYNECIVSYGDSRCLLNDKNLIDERVEDIEVAVKRSNYNKMLLANGYTVEELMGNDLGWKYIMDDMIFVESFANIKFPCINGTPIKRELIKEFKVNSGDMVVLASDGYPILCNTLKESEDKLEEVISKDPLCIDIFKCAKGVIKGNRSFDDRAYIRFKIK